VELGMSKRHVVTLAERSFFAISSSNAMILFEIAKRERVTFLLSLLVILGDIDDIIFVESIKGI